MIMKMWKGNSDHWEYVTISTYQHKFWLLWLRFLCACRGNLFRHRPPLINNHCTAMLLYLFSSQHLQLTCLSLVWMCQRQITSTRRLQNGVSSGLWWCWFYILAEPDFWNLLYGSPSFPVRLVRDAAFTQTNQMNITRIYARSYSVLSLETLTVVC